MEHGFHLGQSIKRKYDGQVDFASLKDSVFSTDYDRTVDTVTSLLLGVFAGGGTHTHVDTACSCRIGNGTRSSPKCIAECIGIDSDHLPAIPTVTVRPEDPALQQANVCKGWKEWIDILEASDEWKDAVNDQFLGAKKRLMDVTGEAVKALKWPDGECEGCANLNDDGFNPIIFMEQVLSNTQFQLTHDILRQFVSSIRCQMFHYRISSRVQAFTCAVFVQVWSNLECYDADEKTYSEKLSNSELLSTLQPVADFTWQSKFASSKGNLTVRPISYYCFSHQNRRIQRVGFSSLDLS